MNDNTPKGKWVLKFDDTLLLFKKQCYFSQCLEFFKDIFGKLQSKLINILNVGREKNCYFKKQKLHFEMEVGLDVTSF